MNIGILLNWLSGSFLSFNQYCLDLAQIYSQPDALLQEPFSSRQCNIFMMALVTSAESEIYSWVSSAKPAAAQHLSGVFWKYWKGMQEKDLQTWSDCRCRILGKKGNGVASFSGVPLKPDFVSAKYTRLGYIHSAFKGGREISNSLPEIKKPLQINTATPSWILLLL